MKKKPETWETFQYNIENRITEQFGEKAPVLMQDVMREVKRYVKDNADYGRQEGVKFAAHIAAASVCSECKALQINCAGCRGSGRPANADVYEKIIDAITPV